MNIYHDIDSSRITPDKFIAVIEIEKNGKNNKKNAAASFDELCSSLPTLLLAESALIWEVSVFILVIFDIFIR